MLWKNIPSCIVNVSVDFIRPIIKVIEMIKIIIALLGIYINK
jgi:hypothetical protein